MLGFALHPAFESNGLMYAFFVVERHHLVNCDSPRDGVPVCGSSFSPGTHDPPNATIGRIIRLQANLPAGELDYRNAESVRPDSRATLLGESHWLSDPGRLDPAKSRDTGCPMLHLSHGVGTLAFGEDGSLLASCGDGAYYGGDDVGSHSQSFFVQALADGILRPAANVGTFRSQLVDSFSGKILRLDPITGDGLGSNPFFDPARPRSARSRVFALGFRNPFRFVVEPETGEHDTAAGNPGRLYVGDVGQRNREELNVIRPGGLNAGWPIYEGLQSAPVYPTTTTVNVGAESAVRWRRLHGPHFRFVELLKEDTLGTPSWPNPCNPSAEITAADVFLHHRPALSWGHDSALAEFPAFDGDRAVAAAIGTVAPDSTTVVGGAFSGATSVGGTWYYGSAFPEPYRGTYFHADYISGWIRNLRFDANGMLQQISLFADNLYGVVSMAAHPTTGEIYLGRYSSVGRVRYAPTSNVAPVAVAAADRLYGPSPLTIQFSGEESADQNGDPLTYRWDFGDGSPAEFGATAVHAYSATDIRNFDATLTVTDPMGLSSQSTLLVSVNNTPPAVLSRARPLVRPTRWVGRLRSRRRRRSVTPNRQPQTCYANGSPSFTMALTRTRTHP